MSMHIPILTGVQNERISRLKTLMFSQKIIFLKFIFRGEGHLYASFLFFILAIYRKCLLFHSFVWGLRIQLPILTGFQKGRIKKDGWRNVHILLKSVLLKLTFHNADYLYVNCLLFILSVYCKCLLFLF